MLQGTRLYSSPSSSNRIVTFLPFGVGQKWRSSITCCLSMREIRGWAERYSPAGRLSPIRVDDPSPPDSLFASKGHHQHIAIGREPRIERRDGRHPVIDPAVVDQSRVEWCGQCEAAERPLHE